MNFNVIPTYHRVTKHFTQSLLSLPSDLIFSMANLDWVENHFLHPNYQDLLQKHSYQASIESLGALDQSIVKGLKQQGLFVTSLEALEIFNTDQFLEAASVLKQEMSDRAQDNLHPHTHTLSATAQQLMAHRKIFDWGLSNRLLAIIEHYLGLPVAYDGVSLDYSIANGRIAGPRRWHRDREDWRMVKIIVYLTDVDSESGPFECVMPYVNDQLLQHRPKHRRFSHLHEQGLSLSDDGFTSCTGKAGTVIFVDTAVYYHHAKPPVTNDRVAVFFSYFSQNPKNPFLCGRSRLSDGQIRSLANTLPDHLRATVLWKDHLTGLSKYIPKNRLSRYS
jgi:hypothetical protein